MEAVMKFSIVTVCCNLPQSLPEMIRSVKAQDSIEIEHIVVDHGYSDPQCEMFRTQAYSVSHFEFLPYAWVYEAWNRGISLATGDVIALIHGCDVLADSRVLKDVEHALDHTGADAVYGDLAYVAPDDTDALMRYWRTGFWTDDNIAAGWIPPLCTFFARREIYERYKTKAGEYFDTSLETDPASDMLRRFLSKKYMSVTYLDRILVKVRVGSPSNQILADMLSDRN
jgi:glycosyltransferase